jgi:hypothetical protein
MNILTILIALFSIIVFSTAAALALGWRPLAKLTLLPNAPLIWEHWSTKALAALVAIQTGWAMVPVEVYPLLPDWLPVLVGVISGLTALFGMFSKFIHQPKLPPPPEAPAAPVFQNQVI